MKILNLYAGIGGNRKLWGDEHDITAVEWDEETAKVYQDYFPNDTVIIDDAHEYLLDHYDEYDFIWSSPPCPTHSKLNNAEVRDLEYPDMRLYQEIIVLQKKARSKWVIENVEPYYDYLIAPSKVLGRHPFWCNFTLGNPKLPKYASIKYDNDIKTLCAKHGFDLDTIKKSNIKNKRKALRNCVQPELGKYILDRAMDIYVKSNTEQSELF